MRRLFALLCLGFIPLLAACATPDARLQAAIASPERAAANRARDAYRNPEPVLSFFGLRDDMAVLEIYPGAGWWTEILAPYLDARGTYHAAAAVPTTDEGRAFRRAFEAKLAADRARFGKVKIVDFAADGGDIVPPGSVDMVLTFRNLHNWVARGTEDAVLKSFFRALKPGGTLGLVDHRASNAVPQDPKAKNGYVREDHAIALAERAGFKYVGRSDVKSNPKDTKDYPEGVWTLPPTLRLKDKDRAKYEAIGESDRFVLKFTKPGG